MVFRRTMQTVLESRRLRLAVCGAWKSHLENLSPSIRERVDYLGQLGQGKRVFAAAIDLRIASSSWPVFQPSRFPVKFCEHIAVQRTLALFDDRRMWPSGQPRFGWAFNRRDSVRVGSRLQ